MAKTYYEISNLTIEANHQKDLLFLRMHSELKPYWVNKAPPAKAFIEIIHEKQATLAPPEAVHTGCWPEFDEHRCLLNNIIYYQCGGKALFIKNYRQKRLSIRYASLSERVLRYALTAIKWLVIKCAEENDQAFVHGAAVHYRGKNIIFAGHPGSGKSSCLLRLNQAGAKVISDDATLIREGELAPFYFDLNTKGDLAQRFQLDQAKECFEIGRNISSPQLFQGVDMIFFPQIWNHPTSRIRPVSCLNAFKRLNEIYMKEVAWNAYPEKQDVCEKKYAPILAKARCFDFFAGHHEEDARKCLLNFIRRS